MSSALIWQRLHCKILFLQYDAKFEKSENFNHQKDNALFNKASQYLTPVRKGLRNVQASINSIVNKYSNMM